MNEESLKKVYGDVMAARGASRAGCPEPEALLALVRREGSEEARLATLDHAMSCAACRADLDLLRSIEGAGTAMGAGSRSGARRWFVPAAIAASVLLAVGVGRLALAPSGEDELTRSTGDPIVLVSPPVETAAGAPLAFTWRALPGAGTYRLEVLTADGEVALAVETADTSIAPPAAVTLPPGSYRWWVRGSSPEAPRSALRPLRLTAQ